MEEESPGSLKGIKFLSELDLGHSEARLHQLIESWKLTVPIRISLMRRGLVYVPLIRCTTWFDYLMNNKAEILCGGFGDPDTASLQNNLHSFWKAYRLEDPNHDVFLMHNHRLKNCVPLYLYSDEGRGYRKSPVQVFALETMFGIPDPKKRFNVGDLGGDLSYLDFQVQPSKGHSFNSRLLICVIPHVMYKGDTGKLLWRDMAKEIADDCCKLFHHGAQVRGKGGGLQQFYGIILGHKGDFPALCKAGNICRSFMNLGNPAGMCPFCLAGTPGLDWEDVDPNAAWTRSLWQTEPWMDHDVPSFRAIPCDQTRAANFYKADPFHIFKYGIGRHFCASIIVMLCQWGYFPGPTNNIKDMLIRAFADFKWACKNEIAHACPNMKGFTKELFHFPRLNSFPWGGWKGSDTMLLLRWILRILRHGIKNPDAESRPQVSLTLTALDPSHIPVFEAMHDGARSSLMFFRILHQPNLWETRADTERLVQDVDLFCASYAFLAKKSMDLQLCRFHMEPSLHQFQHLGLRLKLLLENSSAERILSPCTFLCESGEDFIGRVARISRRAPPRNLCMRTLQRYLIKVHQIWSADVNK